MSSPRIELETSGMLAPLFHKDVKSTDRPNTTPAGFVTLFTHQVTFRV